MQKRASILLLIFLSLPIVSADILSINSGGDSQIVIIPNQNIEGFFFGNLAPAPVDNSKFSSGGNSGGGGANVTEFDLSPALIKITLKQGEVKKGNFIITNKLNRLLNITSIKASREIKPFISFSEDSITLLPKESRKIETNFFAQATSHPQTYIGKITVKGKNTEKTINVIIEIEENKPLFDVTVDLDRKGYAPGETVIAKIDTINFGELKNVDVSVYYAIKDFEGNVFSFKEESYAIENYRIQLVGKLDVPKNTPSNDYVFYVKVSYENITATGSQMFTVNQVGFSPGLGSTFVYTTITIFGILTATTVYFLRHKIKKENNPSQPTNFK